MKDTNRKPEAVPAAENYPEAMRQANALKWGLGGEVDLRRADELYRFCTGCGDRAIAAAAYYNLGLLSYFGLADEADAPRAFNCFIKSVLIRPTREALSYLADMYRYGQYVERDEAIALSLYLQAAGT